MELRELIESMITLTELEVEEQHLFADKILQVLDDTGVRQMDIVLRTKCGRGLHMVINVTKDIKERV